MVNCMDVKKPCSGSAIGMWNEDAIPAHKEP